LPTVSWIDAVPSAAVAAVQFVALEHDPAVGLPRTPAAPDGWPVIEKATWLPNSGLIWKSVTFTLSVTWLSISADEESGGTADNIFVSGFAVQI
jgi:hypothetical protein